MQSKTIVKTKLVARRNYNQRRSIFQRQRTSRVKKIEGRIKNKDIKIKKHYQNFKMFK